MEKQRCLPIFSFSRRDEEIYSFGGKKKDQRYYSNMGEPIRTREGKLAGRGKHDARLGCVAQVKKRDFAHLSSAGKKSSITKMKRNRKRTRTKRTGAKRRHIAGRAYNTGHGGSKATSKWQRSRITLLMMLGSQRSHCHDITWQIRALLTAVRASGGKDKCQVYLAGIELNGHRDWQITRLWLPGTVTAGDGSDQKRGENGSR